jgi:microcin C transport system substrate-binding protein
VTRVSRRAVLGIGAGALATSVSPIGTWAQRADGDVRHGISSFGDLKYPPDFPHFGYVDPKAPKGGTFSQIGPNTIYNQNPLTFNSFNSYILSGDAAQGMELTFASLMTRANDEPDAMYGLAARSVRISADRLTYRFALRPEARFHDGSRLTAHDVAFSLAVLKKSGHPIITQLLREFAGAEAEGDATVVLRFAPKRARDVPLFAASLPIFSRAYYATRKFDESTLDIPLGSGPYRVGRFEPGRYVEYHRVADWWGTDLPVSRGRHNFDVVRLEYFRDREVGFEGFTARSYLFREEFTSRTWATRYKFPAIKDGRVKREVLPDDTPSGAQGWFINTRRPKLQNPKLREALNCAFDFEWTNKTIMYGAYERTQSVFQNSEMMASGKPSPEELALLEPFRGKVPDEVFGVPYVPPVSDGSGQDRVLLRRGSRLLREAGYAIRKGKRVSPQGEPVTIEFLFDEPSFQAHHMPFIKNLATLGIDASLRIVDPVQMQQRLKQFDFDITIQRFSFSSTPGESLRSYFTSQAAQLPGSQNLAGIADPAVDAMIDRIIAAQSRAALTTACRALDRLIRAGRYWIPHWYKASHWIAYWDTFGRPPGKPRYARGVLETWWYDRDKASKIEHPR